MTTSTIVHLMRHGEVHNPLGVLYGRIASYHLSELGHQMAAQVADSLKDHDIRHLVASPLERAQETAKPLSDILGLPIETDERVIEAGNQFEGLTFGKGEGSMWRPRNWWLVRNPTTPSWGEPYTEIAARMRSAIDDVRETARGHEAVIVSHQLPVWTARRMYEKKRYTHDPRRRQCTLASLTSITFEDDRCVDVTYSEPAGDLLPAALKRNNQLAGGA